MFVPDDLRIVASCRAIVLHKIVLPALPVEPTTYGGYRPAGWTRFLMCVDCWDCAIICRTIFPSDLVALTLPVTVALTLKIIRPTVHSNLRRLVVPINSAVAALLM